MSLLSKKKASYAYISAIALTLLSANFPRELSYSGRLTDAVGKPISGPINLQISFYYAESGSTKLGSSPYVFNDVKLDAAGLFAVTLSFPASDLQAIFGDTGQAVWLELKDLTHERLYPRQRFNVVPYALRVPVDGVSIGYNAQDELQIIKVELNQISGLSAALAGKAAAADLAAKADAVHTHTLSGDVSGNLSSTSVSQIQGVPVTAPVSGPDNGKYLTYDGSTLKLVTLSPASSTTSASALTSGTLNDARLSSNVSLLGNSIDTAEITDGAITAAKLNAMGCVNGQILKFDGTSWACGADDDSATTNASGLTSGMLADARLSNSVSVLGSSIETGEIADGAVTAVKLSAMGCTNDQILKFNGTTWACAADNDTPAVDASLLSHGTLVDARLSSNVSLLGSSIETAEISSGAVTAAKLNDMGCVSNQILKFNGTSWTCAADQDNPTTNAALLTSGILADARLSSNVSLLGSSIDSTDITDEAVTAVKLAAGAVGSTQLIDGSVSSAKLASGSVDATQLADGAITAAKFSTMGCTSNQILKFNGTNWVCAADSAAAATTDASALTSGMLADARLSSNVSLLGSSIDTADLTNGAVTSAKIATEAVGTIHIGDGSVSSAKLANGAIGTTQLADSGVTSVKMADGAITAAKLNAMGCSNDQILKFNGSAWACATDDVGTPTTDASTLTSGTLEDARYSANVSLLGTAIDTAEITDSAVTSAKVADGAITAAKLNAMSCTSGQILKFDGTSWVCAVDSTTVITSDASVLVSGVVADARLSSNVSRLGSTIDAAEITAAAVTSAKIADGAVTAAKLDAMGCTSNQILKFNGTSWACATDNSGGAPTTDASVLISGTLADARLSANVSRLGTSIDTAEITDGAVTSAKVADSAVTAAKLNTMGCTSSQILKFNGTSWVCAADDTGTPTTDAADLTSGTLADARLSSNVSLLGSSIDTAEITAGAVTSAKFAVGAVDTIHLADGGVSSAKVAAGAVGTTQLADSSVTALKIADGAITAAKLNAMGCTSGQILKYNGTSWSCSADDEAGATTDASTLTTGTLADARLSSNVSLLGSSIDTAEITSDAVTSVKIADGAVTAAKLAAMGCSNNQILKFNGTSWGCAADDAGTPTSDASVLTTGTLADARLSSNVSLFGSSIDTAEIAASAVTSAKIAAGAVGTTQIADGSVSSAKFAAGAIGTTQLTDLGVTTTKIADGAITFTKLNAMGCSSGQILKYNGSAWVCAVDTVAAATTDASSLTSGTLADARLSANVSLLGSSIDTNEISANAVTTAKLAIAAVGLTELADGSVTSAKVESSAAGTMQLADSSVTAVKIADGAITAAKLTSCASTKILKFNGTSWGCADDDAGSPTTDASALTSGILADARLSSNVSLLGAMIDTADIAATAVTSAKIADGAITAVKLNAMGCTSGQILKYNGSSWACGADSDSTTTNAATLTSGTLADARLSSNVSRLGNMIDTAEITDGAVTTAKIIDSSITSVKIADGTIVDADFSASAAIADSKLATISTAGKVSGSAITSGTIGGSAAVSTTGAVAASGHIVVSAAGGAAKQLRFYDKDTANYLAFKSPATVSSNQAWTLPAADGTASYFLATNGSGALTWQSSKGTRACTGGAARGTYNGHCYIRYGSAGSTTSWPYANAFCQANGGYLATITSAGENSYIDTNIRGTSTVWIGGNDQATEGQWEWVNRETWSYTNWNSGEPNNNDAGVAEHCLSLKDGAAGKWNDARCDLNLAWICEFE